MSSLKNRTTGEVSVGWLTQGGATLPSVRFRVCPFFEAAKKRGLTASVRRYPKSGLQRLLFLTQALVRGLEDVLILQKRLLPAWEVRILRRVCSRLVYDFDDAVWADQTAPSEPGSGRHWARFERMCQLVDLVIAGNQYLAAAVPVGIPVLVLPTPIDTQLYTPSDTLTYNPEIASDTVRIGWMGTSSYLPGIEATIRQIATTTGLPVTIISDIMPDWHTDGLTVFRFWSAERELAELQAFDIGLMPLDDSAYTRGKGGFKLLQYMACGVVPIASAVGFNREIIEHGVNGFLVSHPEQWDEYISLLRTQPALRLKLARAARATVCDRFDIQPTATRLFNALLQL